ncbi:kinase-like protein [Mycena polygramma]|nr:kinase-like protein [Mycena polygramma]
MSEGLGAPAEKGYGWAQLEFGESIGDDHRYTILRKLGWGMHSSTWLARDRIQNGFVAVKALTGYMTGLNESGMAAWETDALRLLSQRPQSAHCTPLLDELKIQGRGSAGSHKCFVLPVYGGDVKALGKSRNDGRFELATAKRIILHLLRGIAHAHDRGVVHTDLKPDNIFFSTQLDAVDIEQWMEEDPPRRHLPEMSQDGIVQTAVSQPLPMISDEAARNATYTLSDFGCAMPSKLHDDREITTRLMRPPESYLGGQWDTPADIWAFGCLCFELLASRPLFEYTVHDKFSLTEIESMLYQMLVYTGEPYFRAEQLSIWARAGEYFTGDCQLKKKPTVFQWPLEQLVLKYRPEMAVHDVAEAAMLIRRCLRLNRNERATAEALLQNPWLKDADG